MKKDISFNKRDINFIEMLVFVLQNVEGDPFTALVELCKPVIYNSIENRYIRGFDREDFLQEAKKALFEAVTTYKFGTDLRFMQYYSMCLKNHLNMLVRQHSALKRKASKDASSLDEHFEKAGFEYDLGHDYRMNPEDNIVAKETYDEYLLALSPLESSAFYYYLHDYSHEEIAKRLDSSKEQIQNAIYRCSLKFRRLINKKL